MMLQGETMSIMFVDGAEAPFTNIMDMVSPYAHSFALWNYAETNRLWVGTSSTAMGAPTTSVSKYLEHRNACVGLAGNNMELAGSGRPELKATAIREFFAIMIRFATRFATRLLPGLLPG